MAADPTTLAKDALMLILDTMPPEHQAGRAPVEARRHLLGTTEGLPEATRNAAFDALERMIEDRFGPQNVKLPPAGPPPPARVQVADLTDAIDIAVGGAFSAPFDGSAERLDVLSDRARGLGRAAIDAALPRHWMLSRQRALRLLEERIAQARADLQG